MKAGWLAAGLITVATASAAQELILGLGYSDYKPAGAEDSALVSVEYHAAPFRQNGNFSMGIGGVASAQGSGDVFIGAGLVAKYALSPEWTAELSVMPGAYFENDPLTDLGSSFQIRSLAGIAYQMPSGDKVSLALVHKSNAGLASYNPGVNSLVLRWHRQF